MTARVAAFALGLLVAAAAAAQHFHHRVEAPPEKRVSICDKTYQGRDCFDSDKRIKWMVNTGEARAQWCFEQGLTELYGFNYEDAIRNFERALFYDKDLAIAHWGIALAAGPNINIGQDDSCAIRAFTNAKRALELADQQPKISDVEKALIVALTARYPFDPRDPKQPKDPVQPVAYAVAMRGVWEVHKPHPQVGALYAESLLDLRPWALYDDAKRPAIDTDEVRKVLLAAYKQLPEAIGANHYLIHTVEAGPDPELAKDSANLLFDAVPSSGHLLHMPSHTYLLMGDYAKAVAANENAVTADVARFYTACQGDYEQYKKQAECQQLYYGHYLSHNLYFRAVAKAFMGRSQSAIADAMATRQHVQHFVANEPGLERYMAAQLLFLVAHGKWAEIRFYPLPEESCWSAPFTSPGCRILRSVWFWAQGMERTANKPFRVQDARKELDNFREERAKQSPVTGWGNNDAVAVLAIAESILRARIAWAETKEAEAIEHLKLAVSHEDALVYDEPPQWVFPARQALGGAYLSLKTPDPQAAMRVFCDDLRRHPKNGRSLFGIYSALPATSSWKEAYRKQYLAAWEHADSPLTVNDLWLLDPKAPAAEPGGGSGSEAAELGAAAAGATDSDPCPLVASPG